MKYLFVLLSFLFISNVSAELLPTDTNFSRFINNLKIANIDFIQTKNIPNLKRPFTSKGKIKFERDKGFIWFQTEPNDFKFVSTKERYCTADTNNSLSKLPHYSDFSELIDKVLVNDYSMLNSAFSVEYTEKQQNWEIVLVPKIDEITDIFKQITVTGNLSQLFEIKFEYVNNSIVTIKFSHSKVVLNDEISC